MASEADIKIAARAVVDAKDALKNASSADRSQKQRVVDDKVRKLNDDYRSYGDSMRRSKHEPRSITAICGYNPLA